MSPDEREQLETLIRKGKSPAQRLLKARILLKADVSEAGEGGSDGRNAAAIRGVALTYLMEFVSGWGNEKIDFDPEILGQADRAVALAPDDPRPYSVKSAYLALSRRFDEAVRVADDGLAVSPNFPYLYGARATAEIALGPRRGSKIGLSTSDAVEPA